MNIGAEVDSCLKAVSTQMTVINQVGCRYLPTGMQLPSQPHGTICHQHYGHWTYATASSIRH